jgi:hypothetical protein
LKAFNFDSVDRACACVHAPARRRACVRVCVDDGQLIIQFVNAVSKSRPGPVTDRPVRHSLIHSPVTTLIPSGIRLDVMQRGSVNVS